VLFFQLNTWLLALLLLLVLLGATAVGLLMGHAVRGRSADLREPFSVMQAALLGFMGLVLAFGLSLAVGRYEARRVAVVDETNAIGTTYLRAQTIAEPQRSRSLDLLKRFNDISITLSRQVPGSSAQRSDIAASGRVQQQLWSAAGQALDQAPTDSAPRLYVESLNEMFDAQSSRVAGLGNRVPTPVLVLEIVGAAIALAVLALHLSTLGGPGVFTVLIAAILVEVILLVTFDLDRPTRGFIRVPIAPLVQERASMELPPAALPPTH
jgi:hypothetical protein